MQIEICFSPSLIQLYEHRDSVVVVTDVFRATTTICTAFANGASYIIPVVMLIKNGEIVGKKVGLAAKADIQKLIDANL